MQHGVMRNPKMILAENLSNIKIVVNGLVFCKFCDKINVFHFARGEEF